MSQYYQPAQTDKGSKKQWSKRDWLVKVIIPIAIPLLAALIAAGYFATKSAASIPILAHSYTGSVIRDNDGANFDFALNQVSENQQSGDFTASATINGCPAEVSGSVKATNTISFTLTESTACQDRGLIGNFTGNINPGGDMTGRWSTNNGTVQIVGSWSLQ
jgi:hypothetical protein